MRWRARQDSNLRHHESLANEHRAVAELHQLHSVHHDAEGEMVKAAHSRQVGHRHTAIAKLHADHAEELDEMRGLVEAEHEDGKKISFNTDWLFASRYRKP
jgi:hypothetical protein